MTTNSLNGPKTLTPLSMGQILDRAFRVYRQQFVLLLGIVAAFQAPLALGQLIQGVVTNQMFSSMQSQNLESMFAMLMAGSLAGNFLALVAAVLTQFGYAALAVIIVHSYLGEPLSFAELVGRVRESFWQLVIAIFFILVLNVALMLYAIVVPILGWFTGLGMFLFVSIAIVPLVTPVVILEQRQALDALRRVWDLTRQRFWWVFCFGGVLFIMAAALAAGPTVLAAGGAQFLFSDGGQPSLVANLVTTLVSLAVGIIFIPIQIAALVIMYLDLRVRYEGLDLALQTAATEDNGATITTMLRQVPAGFNPQLVTRNELLNFFYINLGMLLFIGLVLAGLVLLFTALAATLGGGGF